MHRARQTVLQRILTELIDGAVLTGARISALHDSGPIMNMSYDMTVPAYAQHTGNLLLFRSCVLGHKGSSLLEGRPRKQPVVFPNAAFESDVLEISLPVEYSIDEVPRTVKYEYPFANYNNETTVSDHELKYTQTYERHDIRIALEKIVDLKKLYSDIGNDERGDAILRVPF